MTIVDLFSQSSSVHSHSREYNLAPTKLSIPVNALKKLTIKLEYSRVRNLLLLYMPAATAITVQLGQGRQISLRDPARLRVREQDKKK